jgi:uncharacterized protein YwqG
MDNPQQIRDLLIANGLGDKAEALMAVVRPCVRVNAEPAEDETIPVGVSKIGGQPDLPEGFAWPMWEHEPPDWYAKEKQPIPDRVRPLGFLAQFNLAEAAPYDVGHLLPTSGMLYFFYDYVEQPWAQSVREGDGARILYYEGSDVQRRHAPENLPAHNRFTACRVTFELAYTLPMYYTPYVEHRRGEQAMFPDAVALSDEEEEGYEVVELAALDGSGHQLLGHPIPVQHSVEVECEAHVAGMNLNTNRNARRWRLLLQLDSDNKANMMWGDLGNLYFCLPEESLTARRFDDGVVILQCS